MIWTILFFLAVCILLGYRVIAAVPPLLHTPLMSGMNALSGITVLGSLVIYAVAPPVVRSLAVVSILLATVNVVGGFWVTERMLRMFTHDRKDGEGEVA
ncbi:MAG TPA: NAD(P) transhydrogenase subunit alpha [Candidatus Limnocylindrales bacterium]|nr:NAD(P) transhydrogenase subunit alpha [Candidatus Limnocylindrales bacterium]